ncbi:putative RiPP precursor [Streptomyces nodosus]|uniref:Putative RiPP n=1 Tax=Streptomyces nodosus TaxID=40318 RepID=A0A5P2W8N4_9ACTN|nr:putative RiPP precursor [Streptomyces nodosus]
MRAPPVVALGSFQDVLRGCGVALGGVMGCGGPGGGGSGWTAGGGCRAR